MYTCVMTMTSIFTVAKFLVEIFLNKTFEHFKMIGAFKHIEFDF